MLLPRQALEPSPPGSLPSLQFLRPCLCPEPVVRIICLLVISTPRPDLGLLRALAPTMGTDQATVGRNGEGAIWEVGDALAFALAVAVGSSAPSKMAEALRGTASRSWLCGLQGSRLGAQRCQAPSAAVAPSQLSRDLPAPPLPQVPGWSRGRSGLAASAVPIFPPGLRAAAAGGGGVGAQLPRRALRHAAALLPHLPHLRAW